MYELKLLILSHLSNQKIRAPVGISSIWRWRMRRIGQYVQVAALKRYR
jgi:hypothetical protein